MLSSVLRVDNPNGAPQSKVEDASNRETLTLSVSNHINPKPVLFTTPEVRLLFSAVGSRNDSLRRSVQICRRMTPGSPGDRVQRGPRDSATARGSSCRVRYRFPI